MKKTSLLKLLIIASFLSACASQSNNQSINDSSTNVSNIESIPSESIEDSSSNVPQPDPLVICPSWEDFKLWNEYPNDYWNITNKYEGNRRDFRNESIYYVTTTRFYDGDSSNNVDSFSSVNADDDPAWKGDFKGLIEKMDYIKALGFTTIWITPVVENSSLNDFEGNYALNMNQVDSRLCSQDVDFQKVIDEAHQRDMKICLEVVMNHTGTYGESNLFPLFYKDGDLSSEDCLKIHEKSSLSSDYFSLTSEEKYQARIAKMNSDDVYSDINNIYHHNNSFETNTFYEQIGHISQDVMDLNTENPVVAEYLVRSYGQFIKMGVDAFKIDSAKNISRLTYNKYLIPALYEFASKCGNENFFIFGEVSSNTTEIWNNNIPALSAPFYTWNEEKEYTFKDVHTNMESIKQAYDDNSVIDNERTSTNAILNEINYHTPDYSSASKMAVVDYPMHMNFSNARNAFNVALQADQYYNDSTYNVMYVDSNRFGPEMSTTRYASDTTSWAENLNLMFTFRGIPCIYYGSEIEFSKGMPLNASIDTPLKETAKAYYGDYIEGIINVTDFASFNASGEVSNTLNNSLAKHIIKLNKVRQEIAALRMGQYTADPRYVSNGNIAFIRRYTGNGIDSLALVSISGGATFTNIPNGKYIDAITGDVQNVTRGMLTTSEIGTGNMRVYVCCASGYQGIDGAIGPTGQSYLK